MAKRDLIGWIVLHRCGVSEPWEFHKGERGGLMAAIYQTRKDAEHVRRNCYTCQIRGQSKIVKVEF